ncbi:transmembrane domain-containing protein [Cryptosporidium sp. 43IA8]|nr:transmembrane domain-containing protein [Cryptosporidium sp. 43IA8]
MISSLENGPTEEDLELLLGGYNKEEEILFVDLREESDELDKVYYQENSNFLNPVSYMKRIGDEQNQDAPDKLKKRRVKSKKTRPRRKKSKLKDDSDKLSIDSDEFVVPDDEVIPPDWEYNFEKPIVCQNVTFYNKVDNILTEKLECNDSSLDEDFFNNCEINEGGFKGRKRKNGMIGIDIDKEYIDDKDNTALIVESHLLKDDIDDEDQVIFVDRNLNSFIKQVDKNKTIDEVRTNDSEPVIVESDEFIINTEIFNYGIFNIYFKMMDIIEDFENYNNFQCFSESSFKLEGKDISTLLIVFKSIDIEFSSFSNNSNSSCSSGNISNNNIGSFDLIQSYLDLFYNNILNSSKETQNFNSTFLKELHFEMIGFIESKFDEIVQLNPSEWNYKVLFLFLRIIGLTLFVEHLLIHTIKIEKTSESKISNLNEEFSVFFVNENILNKNNVSKILRQILKKMLDHLLNLTLKENLNGNISSIHCILILTLFINFKVSGDLIFTYISEKYIKDLNITFDFFLIYYYAMIIYSNFTDLKFDISKLFAKFIFDLKGNSSNKNECLNHYYLLNEYLKSVNVYQLNNINCKNKFESLLYCLSDSNFFYNINKENEVNICLSLFSIDKLNSEIFYSNLPLNNLKLKEIHHNMRCFDKKLRNILFLKSGKDEEHCKNYEKMKNNLILPINFKEINLLELTEEIYFNLLNLLVNLIKNINELNLLLKFLHMHFDIGKASNISKNDIIMHYLVYNTLFIVLLLNSNLFEFEIPIINLYYTYLEENDQINNFLLTEMVLDNENTENNHLSEKIKLNKNYKLLIQTLLGSSKFGIQIELKFHIDMLYNIITLIEPLAENKYIFEYLKQINNLKLNELFYYNSNKIIPQNIPNNYLLNSNELILHSKLISNFNSNILFAHVINTGIELLPNACKINVDIKQNELLIRLIIYFKIIIEEKLDIYFESINKLSDVELDKPFINFIDEIFNLINNLSILLVWNFLEINDTTAFEFLIYYFGLISDKLFYYIKYYKNGQNNKGKQICELFIFHMYRNLGGFILRFFNKFKENIKIECEIYSFMIVFYLLMFNINHFNFKSYYKEYLKIEKEIFEKIQILNINKFGIPEINNKRNVIGKLKNFHFINYYIKKKICNNLNSIYKLVGVISNEWKSKINKILDYIEFIDLSNLKESSDSESIKFNINDLILELYFDYYISNLDCEILQIINKKVINYSINLYSTKNIYGLLINFILKGIHEKNNNSNMELILNWNHINNSIKGYINQLKNDLLINIWINYDFIQMFMIPSSFSCRFIYMRIHFWINILSIPLSKMLINSNEDFNNVRITLEYPMKYFKKLLIIKDFNIFKENIINFSINFIIDSVRLIQLSYFKIILKMFISKIQKNNTLHNLEFEEFTKFIFKLITYMKLISNKTKLELESNHVNNQFKIDNNTKCDIIDIISLLISYLNQVSEAVHDFLVIRQEFIQNNNNDNNNNNDFKIDDKPIQQINYELLKKKTEWINYFIYSSNLNYSDHSENITKFNILEYILNHNNKYSLSIEFQKLPKIFQYIKKETSKMTIHKLQFFNNLTFSDCTFSNTNTIQLF